MFLTQSSRTLAGRSSASHGYDASNLSNLSAASERLIQEHIKNNKDGAAELKDWIH